MSTGGGNSPFSSNKSARTAAEGCPSKYMQSVKVSEHNIHAEKYIGTECGKCYGSCDQLAEHVKSFVRETV